MTTTAEEIAAALSAEGLTEEQILSLLQFLEQAGGIEQARRTIDVLSELRRAA